MGLGPSYRKLWTAAAISTVGDGVHLTALALLAASLTRDPLAVSAVVFAGQFPLLLFSLPGGALVDRWDRRTVLWTVDAFRFAVVAALGIAVLAGWASIPLLFAAGLLLGTGRTLFDTASQAIVPAIVSRLPERLERANGRLQGAEIVGEGFVGPPIGSALFAWIPALPFLADAASFLGSAALLLAIRGRFRGGPREGARSTLRGEVVEGLRWLLGHRLLRALAVMLGVTNLMAGAWLAILVLFAREQLHVPAAGYGLLITSFAVGLVSNGWLAGGLLALLGFEVIVWNVVSSSLRQALLHDRLIGRVLSAYRLISLGTGPLGAVLGGVLGRTLGLRAPFLLDGLVLVPMALLGLRVVNPGSVRAARA